MAKDAVESVDNARASFCVRHGSRCQMQAEHAIYRGRGVGRECRAQGDCDVYKRRSRLYWPQEQGYPRCWLEGSRGGKEALQGQGARAAKSGQPEDVTPSLN